MSKTHGDVIGLIVEYWIRILYRKSLSLTDIISIIQQFGNEYEELDFFGNDHQNFSYDPDTCILSRRNLQTRKAAYMCGSFTAISGRKYHWKLKFAFHNGNTGSNWYNIGIMNKYNTSPIILKCFEQKYFYDKDNMDNERYESHHITDVWLDLRGDKYTIEWHKNGQQIDEISSVPPNTEYKLAICCSAEKIKLLLFEIFY